MKRHCRPIIVPFRRRYASKEENEYMRLLIETIKNHDYPRVEWEEFKLTEDKAGIFKIE